MEAISIEHRRVTYYIVTFVEPQNLDTNTSTRTDRIYDTATLGAELIAAMNRGAVLVKITGVCE